MLSVINVTEYHSTFVSCLNFWNVLFLLLCVEILLFHNHKNSYNKLNEHFKGVI